VKVVKCDRKGCGQMVGEYIFGREGVHIRGWKGKHNGIMVPDNMKEFDFCSQKCFVEWVREGMPDA